MRMQEEVGMAEFMIEAPHTKEECMDVLDKTAEKGDGSLSKFEWGLHVWRPQCMGKGEGSERNGGQ